MSKIGEVCEHGQLKRQCVHCENNELTTTNETLDTENKLLTEQNETYRKQIMELNVANGAMRNLLKLLEWKAFDNRCPYCDCKKGTRHEPDCALAKWVK